MGVRQSKRSVDITTTPKKEGLPVEGVVGDAAAPGDGKLEKIEETDAKPTTNGVAPHTDATPEDKEKDKDEATEKETEKEDETKAEEVKVESPTTETPAEGAAEATTPTEGSPASPTSATSPDSKETKKKDKLKKKWSFRSISFGKKDKSKPAREETPKNGDVTKEEPLAEGGEEAEAAEVAAVASSPADDKSPVSSPTEKEQSEEAAEATSESAKPEEKKTPTKAVPSVASSPVEEKKDETTTTPASNPVPIEANKTEDNEKQVEPAKADKKVEVSQVKAVIDDAPVEVNPLSKQKANTATTAPSIIERKTSEDIPSQFPSSPPPTPIDPSPLQQAQQVAANATALAEALKLPAEAANKANIAYASGQNIPGNTTSFPNSTCQSEATNPVVPVIDKISVNSDISIVSVSQEQTGNASLRQNVVDSADAVVAPTEIIDKPSLIHDNVKEDRAVDELVTESEDVKVPSDTTKSIIPEENDLVILTEEGPIPISNDIIVEAKPALVLPDSPVEDEKTVQVLLEADAKCDSCESTTNIVESNGDLLVMSEETADLIPEVVEALHESAPTPVMENNHEDNDAPDVPPPLPDSPIPLPKATTQLLNFMTTQIENSTTISEIIEDTTKLAVASQDVVSCLLSTHAVEPRAISENIEKIEETTESPLHADKQCDDSLPQLDKVSEIQLDLLSQAIDNDTDESPKQAEIIPKESFNGLNSSHENNVLSIENPIASSIIEHSSVIPIVSIPQISAESTTLLLTPPRSPSNSSNIDMAKQFETSTGESTSLVELIDDQSNREFKMESLEQSLNSYNDSELELKERLAESMEENEIVNCELTNDEIQDSAQSKAEPEAPVENNVVPNDVSTTEVNDEAPMSPPPAVPAETPAPTLGPAITEDVASVTKAIEEIDINEKAVAAAVNEAMESVNTNEIIADMNHQNNMNE